MMFIFYFFVWFGQTIVNWAGREPMHASLGLCFWAVRHGRHVEWSPVGCGVHRISGNYCQRGSRQLSVLAFRPAVLFFVFTFLLGHFALFAVDLFSSALTLVFGYLQYAHSTFVILLFSFFLFFFSTKPNTISTVGLSW